MTQKRNLPKLVDLMTGDLEKIQAENTLNILLNNPPPKNWVKKHPYADAYYLSIERVEFLLTSIFVHWSVEIRKVDLMANSAYVIVRLHYRNPVTGEMQYQDGVGAAPLQTDKNATATDFSAIKSSAVQIGIPAAESYAIKDAAKKLGKMFGKDLNRDDEIGYEGMGDKFDPTSKYKKILSEQIGQCQDHELTSKVMEVVLEAEENGTNDSEFYQNILGTYFNIKQ
jgi:hypothetical protein